MPEKRLKICIVSFDWRDIFRSGFDELKGKLVRDRLGLDENEFFMFSWGPKAYHEKKENIETEHFRAGLKSFRPWYDLLTIFLLPYTLSQNNFRPDVIYVKEFPFVFAGILPRIMWGTKTVFLLSATPASLVKTRKFGGIKLAYQRMCERLARKYIDVPLANGQATQDYFVEMGFRREAVKIFTGNAIKRDMKLIERSSPGLIRQKHSIGPDKKIMLYVGRLVLEKGLNRLLDLFASLKRDDMVLIVAGDGDMRAKLEKQVKDLNIQSKVIFAGNVNREEIWNYYRDADIFILLSYSDGCPTVVREAMFMGVPVIGSSIQSIKAFLGENKERGFLWTEKGGEDEFKYLVDKCLSGGEDVELMKKKARVYVEKEIADQRSINEMIK